MMRRSWPHVLTMAAISVVAVLALYFRTLHFGFYWDDFDDLRPWTWPELASTFVGQYQPWAREGIYFYRPLTSVYLATATTVFGLNSVALHVIPLFTLSIAATLTGLFAHRETGSRSAGAIGSLIYAVHPLTATAVGPWIANQYQGFLVIAVLGALLIWRRQPDAAWRRRAPARGTSAVGGDGRRADGRDESAARFCQQRESLACDWAQHRADHHGCAVRAAPPAAVGGRGRRRRTVCRGGDRAHQRVRAVQRRQP